MSPGLRCDRILLQPPLASLHLCCQQAAAGAKWLSAPLVLSWATLIFLSLATEDAGCDFSQLILMGITSGEELVAPRVPRCRNEQWHQQQGRTGSTPQAGTAAGTAQHLQEMTVLQSIHPHTAVKPSCSQPVPSQRVTHFLKLSWALFSHGLHGNFGAPDQNEGMLP